MFGFAVCFAELNVVNILMFSAWLHKASLRVRQSAQPARFCDGRGLPWLGGGSWNLGVTLVPLLCQVPHMKASLQQQEVLIKEQEHQVVALETSGLDGNPFLFSCVPTSVHINPHVQSET